MLPAIALARALEAVDAPLVLDLCAAPGSKVRPLGWHPVVNQVYMCQIWPYMVTYYGPYQIIRLIMPFASG